LLFTASPLALLGWNLARMGNGFVPLELASAEEPGRVAKQRPRGDLGSNSAIRS
jgi:hypothetical protein